MRSLAGRLLSILVVSSLAACSGGRGAMPSVLPAGAPQPGQLAIGSQIAYGAETTQGAAFEGRDSDASVAFGVLVTMRDPKGLIQYAAEANDPRSGLYRQWLSPQEIGDRFGASRTDYAKVAAYFRGKGLGVAGWQQREVLFVHGSRQDAEAALGARFGKYTKNGVQFSALISAPGALAGLPIAALVGASTYAAAKTAREFVRVTPQGTPSFGNGYGASQIAAAFDYTGAYNAGYTGKGITIGVIGTGPISAADYTAYRQLFHVRGTSTVTQVNVTDAGTAGTPSGYHGGQQPAGTFAAPPPTTAQCTIPATGPDATCNPEDREAQLDTEQTFSLAPDAHVLFYLGYAPANTPGNTSADNFEGLPVILPFEIQQAINDDTTDVLSISYGIGELDDIGNDFNVTNGQVNFATSPGPLQFASLAAEGIAVFAASGDTGNLGCFRDGIASTQSSLCVSYPSVDPNVVGVGGVNAPIGPNGRLTGPLTGWGEQTGLGDAASGGGISAYFPQPPFQVGATNVSGATRNSPDVSLLADAHTGVAMVYDAAFSDFNVIPIGGTSVAAPETAAMWALVLQACAQNPGVCHGVGTGTPTYRLGDPNGLFYAAYKTPTTYAATFYDVVFGDNSELPCSPGVTCPAPQPSPAPGYQAGVGYDRITGLGVPFARALIKTITGV